MTEIQSSCTEKVQTINLFKNLLFNFYLKCYKRALSLLFKNLSIQNFLFKSLISVQNIIYPF